MIEYQLKLASNFAYLIKVHIVDASLSVTNISRRLHFSAKAGKSRWTAEPLDLVYRVHNSRHLCCTTTSALLLYPQRVIESGGHVGAQRVIYEW
jgi:hypothetical protein